MIVSGFALMIVTVVNGEAYESVPAVYDSYKECRVAEDKITKNYYETSCLYVPEIEVNNSSK